MIMDCLKLVNKTVVSPELLGDVLVVLANMPAAEQAPLFPTNCRGHGPQC